MGKALKNTIHVFEPTWGNIMWWLILILSVLFTNLDFFNLEGRAEKWLVQVVYIGIAIGISFLLVLILNPILSAIGLKEYFGKDPNIKVVRASTNEKPAVFPYESSFGFYGGTVTAIPPHIFESDGMRWRAERYYFSRVFFENKKRKWSFETETALRVTAHLRFLNEDGQDLLEHDFIGRWANSTPQPKNMFEELNSPEYTSIDIPADGKEYELDIAMKHDHGEFMVAFNNQNYYGNLFLVSENVVSGKKAFVEVTLTANNIDDKLQYYFELSHDGVGSSIDIREISKNEMPSSPAT
jgi:hypothetical protein